ncbi:MAG: MerR family transcriptional regulator [Clostridia bacterium]|nr:MerR family transcriptional regulator [Deltaproteobacteria bacterium]
MGNDKHGRYRIRAVVEATGISAPTLRSWERRYGIPTPERTQSAYRLYSDDDIAVISRMRDLMLQGVATAEAAHTVRGKPPDNVPTLRDPYEVAAEGIFTATLELDPYGIELAIQRAFTLGNAVTVYERVIAEAMRRIGEQWANNALSIAQEHIAAEVTTNALRDMLRFVQPVDSDRTILLACYQGERHVLALYGIGLRFAAWGFKSTTLGPDCPPQAVAHAVNKLEPDIVGLSLNIAADPTAARALVSGYAEACGTTPWLLGGRAAEFLRAEVEQYGGTVVNGDMQALRAIVEKHVRGTAR